MRTEMQSRGRIHVVVVALTLLVCARPLRGYQVDLEHALVVAANGGEVAEVEDLLARGVEVDASQLRGNTALFRAALGGHLAVVEVLLEAGAQVNTATAAVGLTPLHAAAIDGHTEVVEALLARGADVDAAVEGSGTTALTMAAQEVTSTRCAHCSPAVQT